MNATIINTRIDEIFKEAWEKLDVQEKMDAFSDLLPGGATNASPGSDHNAVRKGQAHG